MKLINLKCYVCDKEHCTLSIQEIINRSAMCLRCGNHKFIDVDTLKVFSTKSLNDNIKFPYIGWHHNAKVIYGGKS